MSQPMVSRSWSGGSLISGQQHLMDVEQTGLNMKKKMEIEFQEGPHLKFYDGYICRKTISTSFDQS
jgi:hypothetical protein